ncbi:MAG: hypothetical protein OEN49_09170, partial [Gammaproteobacteria bacterium]|nr:hypothetical protein [Gammaproteobacteria bacterium]
TDKETVMIFNIVAGFVAVILMLVYLGPVVIKLWDLALVLVILIGFVMMLIDLWQSLQSKED